MPGRQFLTPARLSSGRPYPTGTHPSPSSARASRCGRAGGRLARRPKDLPPSPSRLNRGYNRAPRGALIAWHLLANPAARNNDLGAGYYASRIDKDRKARNHVRQLEALGFTVTLAPAA